MTSGIRAALGESSDDDAIVTMEADNTSDLDDLPRMAIPNLTFVIGDLSDIRSNNSAHYRKLARRLSPLVETVVLAGRSAEQAAKLSQEGITNFVVAPTALDVSRYLDSRPPGVVYLKSNGSLQLWRVLDQVAPAAGPPPVPNRQE